MFVTIATYPLHILNNGIILNMSTPHMPLFQIGVTFFEYAVWIYSGMSAVIMDGEGPTMVNIR